MRKRGGKDGYGMLPKSEFFKVLPNEINKADVRIVSGGNPGIDADKAHHDTESTSLDAVAADIHADLVFFK